MPVRFGSMSQRAFQTEISEALHRAVSLELFYISIQIFYIILHTIYKLQITFKFIVSVGHGENAMDRSVYVRISEES